MTYWLKDMETNSDSDSKEDSVIEAKPSVSFQDAFRKEKFKGFYSNTQKTILCESSMDEYEEKQKLTEENGGEEDDPQFLFEEVLDELNNIPVPVKKDVGVGVTKKIFKSYEDNSAGDETEDSECSGQEHLDDRVENEALQQHPEVNIDQKDTHVSHIIQRSFSLETNKEETGNNDTSSEEDEDDEEPGSEGLSIVKEEENLSDGSSEESDVVVSDLDYYKIRHETEFVEENKFRLKPSTITLTQSMDGRKTAQRRCSIPYIKVIKPRNDEDDNDTDDEDISCKEDDFMTKEEFFEAHKTDFDLTKKQVKLVVSHSFYERSDEETDDDENTESIRESVESDSEITDEDSMMDFLEGIVHSPGCRFAVTTLKNISIIDTSKDENNDYEYIDHSEIEKSAITEMDDTDHTEEDLLTDMEEDNSRGVRMTVTTKHQEGKCNNQLDVNNKTISPRVKKNKKKKNKRQ